MKAIREPRSLANNINQQSQQQAQNQRRGFFGWGRNGQQTAPSSAAGDFNDDNPISLPRELNRNVFVFLPIAAGLIAAGIGVAQFTGITLGAALTPILNDLLPTFLTEISSTLWYPFQRLFELILSLGWVATTSLGLCHILGSEGGYMSLKDQRKFGDHMETGYLASKARDVVNWNERHIKKPVVNGVKRFKRNLGKMFGKKETLMDGNDYHYGNGFDSVDGLYDDPTMYQDMQMQMAANQLRQL